MATENKNVYQHGGDCGIDCEEFINTDCVIYSPALPYLGLEEGASATDVILKLAQTVEFLQEQINELKALHP